MLTIARYANGCKIGNDFWDPQKNGSLEKTRVTEAPCSLLMQDLERP
jgi:hypothetical protein